MGHSVEICWTKSGWRHGHRDDSSNHVIYLEKWADFSDYSKEESSSDREDAEDLMNVIIDKEKRDKQHLFAMERTTEGEDIPKQAR